MERVAVGGLSLHETGVEGLEQAKRALAHPREVADTLAASELVHISTCNRLEIVYARESGQRPGRDDMDALRRCLGLESDPLGERVFLHSGRAAARHLLRVAASLDSLVVGEDQILGQVRQAFTTSKELGLTGDVLGPLFESVVQLGKQVRTETDLSRHPVSVVSLAVHLVAEHVTPAAPVALIGAGETAAHAAHSLVQSGFQVRWIANRTAARAEALASEVGAQVIALDELRSGDLPVRVIVAATSAPEPILRAADLARLAQRADAGSPLVAVDLALPRDLEIPADFGHIGQDPTSSASGVHVDLETLRKLAHENQERRKEAAEHAEELVERKLFILERRGRTGRASQLVGQLFEEARDAFELELARLSRGRLAHLGADERRAIERWARTTFGRLAHLPTRALQELAADEDKTKEPE